MQPRSRHTPLFPARWFLLPLLLTMIALAMSARAFEPRLVRESSGADLRTSGCPLADNTNGTAANYRWFNLCSGYIWIYNSCCAEGEGMGVLFGGPEQPQVNDTNRVKRAITYWRNILPNYDQTVDIYVDQDNEGDGCPDASWLYHLDLDPGLRWNCSEFDVPIPQNTEYLIVRFEDHGGAANSPATDGPYSQTCDPKGMPRSFWYGQRLSECLPWIGPTGRSDNFLHWLIVDIGAPPNAVESSSWGAVKQLFR